MKQQVAVFWFRRDLRLDDNTGLNKAMQSGFPVLPVFIFDRNILDKLENKSDPRLTFIHRELTALNKKLDEQGSTVICYYTKPLDAWKKIISDFNVACVFANEDYEPYARERDSLISDFLTSNSIRFYQVKDQVVFGPGEIIKDNGEPYTIYTPYRNKWMKALNGSLLKDNSRRITTGFHQMPFREIAPLGTTGFRPSVLDFPACSLNSLACYEKQRDFSFLNATSMLGVHLRFGTVSIRRVISETLSVSQKFMDELIWREFYMMILWHFPHVVERAFNPKYENIRWRNNEDEFEKWCLGQTGYPLVDAGMRQLNSTGFMHNRVRMVTAGFLVKHLLVDWKWGEAYFAKQLLDFELSSNNGNWQWMAGTGCDAAPYFRIFNPAEQAKKFDPENNYIRQWVPEFNTEGYPRPMVEHSQARIRCLDTYKEAVMMHR